MLNGQKLGLSSDGELPIVSPKVRGSHQLITIPSQCVFFFILPDSKSKACTAVQIEESKELYKNGLKMGDQEEFDEIDYDTSILDQEDESGSNEKNVYVAFRSKYTKANDESVVQIKDESNDESKANHNEMAPINNNDSYDDNDYPQKSEPVVKYVTFSNNNWLSKFPKSLNKRLYSVETSTYSPVEASTVAVQLKKSVPSSSQSRREQYHILAQAVTGKRYPEKNTRSDLHSNLDYIMASIKPTQTLKLIKRSINKDYNSSEIKDMLEEHTNKEAQSINRFLKTNESSSDWKPKNDNDKYPTHNERKVTQTYKSTNPQTYSEISQIPESLVTSPEITQRTVVTPTTEMSTTALVKQLALVECHVQKIKTRKEQALSKVNERISHKIGGRWSQGKYKGTTINPIEPTTKTLVTTSTKENFTTKNKQTENENIDEFNEKSRYNRQAICSKKKIFNIQNNQTENEKIRYNRQINCSTTIGDNLKPLSRFRLHSKSKKPDEYLNVENIQFTNTPEFETTHFEPSTTKMPIIKSIKPNDYNIIDTPKKLKLLKPKHNSTTVQLKDIKPMLRDSRETEQLEASKLKTKPSLHLLGRVKTSPNVDVDQIVTNEKIAEKLVENIENGKQTLQSEHVISPINKNGENILESKKSLTTTSARIKALEERIKIRRLEMEQKLRKKFHSAKKRSLINDLIEDDMIDVNNILDPTRFESNELDVDIGPLLKRETIVRIPRAVADFTVKLNEVNTYVNKNKKAANVKNNEIVDDGVSTQNSSNDIRPSAEDNEVNDVLNINYKRKSLIDEIDEDDSYGKSTSNMMNKLIGHMEKLWKYIIKAFTY